MSRFPGEHFVMLPAMAECNPKEFEDEAENKETVSSYHCWPAPVVISAACVSPRKKSKD
jgi:hypothetical protein